jgi:hypothetical protein
MTRKSNARQNVVEALQSPASRARQKVTATHRTCAGAKSSDAATSEAETKSHPPRRGKRHARVDTHRRNALPEASDPAPCVAQSIVHPLDRGEGHMSCEAQGGIALPDPLHPVLLELWRQRQDLRRAMSRLDLQCQSIVRRALAGDKEAAAKEWSALKNGKSDNPALLTILAPYRNAMASLDEAAQAIEKRCCLYVRKLPIWTDWAKDVRGMGELSLAGLLGEAKWSFGQFKSVSALWKRMGLAVFDGKRQRLVPGEEAILHGYDPERRAFGYVVSTNLMRSQKDGDKYRTIYDVRKAYELGREIPKAHAHNRAVRYMLKELLKDAWAADRRLSAKGDVIALAA